MSDFIRRMTRRPVLDGTGRVCPDVLEVLTSLRNEGKDPTVELTKCKDYLEETIASMYRNRHRYCKWQMNRRSAYKVGTVGSLQYMLKGVKTILSHLAVERLEKMFEGKL